MEDSEDMKKFFLIVLIASLLVGAFTSILIFLFGNFTEVEVRILLTMTSISAASLVGIIYSKVKNDYVRVLGLTIIGVLFIIAVGAIWELFDGELFLRSLGTALVLMALIGQAPWILRPQKEKAVRGIAVATFICASIVALMIIQLILEFVDFNEFFYRLLGVFGVLYLLGLILIPIMKKLLH